MQLDTTKIEEPVGLSSFDAHEVDNFGDKHYKLYSRQFFFMTMIPLKTSIYRETGKEIKQSNQDHN
jgi:hypothetical protein